MELAERIPKKHRGTAALIAVLIGSTGIQVTTAVATGLFERFSPPAVSGLRLLTAAVILLAVARPRFWRFTRRDWTAVLSYGVVASLMNVFFYLAVQRIPLGVAVTIEYLGAFTVAILGVRRLQDGIFALGALAGVAMIAGPTFGSTDWWGYLFAALAAAAMCGYTLLSARIGSGAPASSGIRGLAVSITIGALLWLPATATAIPRMTGQDWLLAAFIGAFGLALALTVVKAGVVFGLTRLWGLGARPALETALVLAPAGEFAFVVFATGMVEGLAPPGLTNTVALAATVSIFSIPLLAMIGQRLARRFIPISTLRCLARKVARVLASFAISLPISRSSQSELTDLPILGLVT